VALSKFKKLGGGASVAKELSHYIHYLANVRQWLGLRKETRDMMREERGAVAVQTKKQKARA
jgi:hypothetical protein